MIFESSRYANSRIYKAHDARTDLYQITVARIFPTAQAEYYTYTWKETDRIDVLAQRVYSTSDAWHKIMDYNPEIADALNIAPGTQIRLPRD
jgi:phage tail protein X